MIKKHDLFNIIDDKLLSEIKDNISLTPQDNTAFLKIKNCLQNFPKEDTGIVLTVYPREFMIFLRYLVDNQYYDYLFELIYLDHEVMFRTVDEYNLLEYILISKNEDKLIEIIESIFNDKDFTKTRNLDELSRFCMRNKNFDILDYLYTAFENKSVIYTNTFLQLAVQMDSIDAVEYGISKKYPIDKTTIINRKTPLLIAVSEDKNDNITMALVNNGADVNVQDEETGKYVLDFYNTQSELYSILLNAGAKSSSEIGKMFIKTKELIKDSEFELAYQEIKKIVSSDYSKVIYENIDLFCLCLECNLIDHARLLQKNVDPFDYDAELLVACFTNYHEKNYQDIINMLELVIYLWPKGKIICNQEGLLLLLAWDFELFNEMGFENTKNIFGLLKENFGVDISLSYEAFAQGVAFCNFNYVKLAISSGMKPSVVDELHQGIFCELFDEFPLIFDYESMLGLENLCEELTKGGASFNYQDKSGNTVLHRTFLEGLVNEEVLLFYIMLALKFGADLKIKNNEGQTPADTLIINHPNLVDLYRFLKLLENE